MRLANTLGRILPLAALLLTANSVAAQSVQSFADLQPLVAPGERIIVRTGDGDRVQGRLVAVTGNQVEIERRRWFFRTERKLFTEDTVSRIEHIDSTWNGGFLGLGIGVLATRLACKYIHTSPDDWNCLTWIVFAPAGAGAIGEIVDGKINRAIYIAPNHTRVEFLPILGREHAALAIALRF